MDYGVVSGRKSPATRLLPATPILIQKNKQTLIMQITIQKIRPEIEEPPVIGSRRADWLMQKRLADKMAEKDEAIRQTRYNSPQHTQEN